MAFPVPSTDGPPPSPATNAAAAKEAGQLPPGAMPGGGAPGGQGGQPGMSPAGLAPPVQLQPSGPDLSGIMTMGQKIDQALDVMAQAVPLIAADMDQMKAILTNALGKFASQASGTGTSSSMPMGGAGAPTGTVVTQAGNQFPGAMGSGKPF